MSKIWPNYCTVIVINVAIAVVDFVVVTVIIYVAGIVVNDVVIVVNDNGDVFHIVVFDAALKKWSWFSSVFWSDTNKRKYKETNNEDSNKMKK